ncbi:hypothetical protein K3495_g14317 [Podosphaera aphanis]|nr:hypothetical protein K3495_g14317 [Podosphaera aphanis]
MSENRQNKVPDDKAYNVAKPDEKECSFCRARKYKYHGHLFSECRKLKAHKQKKKEKQSNAKVAQEAASNDKNSSDEEIIDTAFVAKDLSSSAWIFDTGASAHMTGCHADFCSFTPLSGQNVRIADNTLVPVTGKGTVKLYFRNRQNETLCTSLQDVLLVPSFGQTRLFSWKAVSDKGFEMFGEGNDIILKNKSGREVLWAKAGRKAHIIQTVEENAHFSSYYEFHMALGHPGLTTVKNPSKLYDLHSTLPSPPTNFHCPTCELSKSKHIIPKESHDNTTKPFELVHSDLSGKFSIPSLGGKYYYISFIDDHTRFSWVKFLKTKDEASQQITNFVNFVNTQYDVKIKRWKTDNGGEFINKYVYKLFKKKGIVLEKTPPYEHERNGVAEIYNQTLTQMARALV